MNTFLRFAIVPAIFAGIGFVLHAQDADKEGARGKVLLLKTGHAMEGDIEKVRAQFCIRNGKSEVWIAADKAIRLCADWHDAFAFASKQIRPDNAGDRVVLARWCHLHQLNDRALEQAQIALELQPTNAEAKQLVRFLERALEQPAVKPAAVAPTTPAAPPEPPMAVDVSFDTLVAFTTKVQPILMNKCVTCHAAGGGKFHLDRVSDGAQKATTQRNLAAVLAQVDLEHPAISPLLVKAITRHGDVVTPPLRDRSDKPAQALQQWIEQAVVKNPQLKDYAKKRTPAKASPEPKSVFPIQRSSAPSQDPSVVSQEAPRLEIDAKNPPRVQPAEVRPAPLAATTPIDEFDALHFNRRFHPAYYQQQTATAYPQR